MTLAIGGKRDIGGTPHVPQQLDEWLHRKIDTLDLPVVMIDGIHFRDSVILVALGIDAKGNKHVLRKAKGRCAETELRAR